MDDSNEKQIKEMLIRLDERFTSEKSARRTREDQVFHRIESIENNLEKLETTVQQNNKEQEEFANRFQGSMVVFKYVYPIINVLLVGLATLAFYLFYTARVEVENNLREDIRVLQQEQEKNNE